MSGTSSHDQTAQKPTDAATNQSRPHEAPHTSLRPSPIPELESVNQSSDSLAAQASLPKFADYSTAPRSDDTASVSSHAQPIASGTSPSPLTSSSHAVDPHVGHQGYGTLPSNPIPEAISQESAASKHEQRENRPELEHELAATRRVIAESSAHGAASSDPELIHSSRLRPSRSATEQPQYPNQALSALHSQIHPPSHHAPYDSRQQSAQRKPRLSPKALATFSPPHLADDRQARTVGNTPIQTPDIAAPRALRREPRSEALDDDNFPSPYLHPTQQHAPKETFRVNREFDMQSGRKLINQYEILQELGKGTHGKVKLARNQDTGESVAIKIVQRYSKKRRLGKGQGQEDKVKKEIAILKKAIHPNVVSMLEVIDDPDLHKVYLVLEFCEAHEVRWRIPGHAGVILVEHRRFDRERSGEPARETGSDDQDLMKLAAERESQAAQRHCQSLGYFGNLDSAFWSLEYAGDSEDPNQSTNATQSTAKPAGPSTGSPSFDSSPDPGSQSLSGQATVVATPRAAETPAHPQDIQQRIASVESSLHYNFMGLPDHGFGGDDGDDVDEQLRYVPMLTLGECRAAFRDALLGLEYLHYQGIVHRDIKPENLLRKADHRVKISDFGVSYLGKPIREGKESEEASEVEGGQDHEEEAELAKTVGTPAFYAPELCSLDFTSQTPRVTGQIDVWALGVTLYCLLYARTPFLANNEFVMMRRIAEEEVFIPRRRLKAVDLGASSRSGFYSPRVRAHHRFPDEIVYDEVDDDLHDLLKRLFIKDPSQRITLREVKHHPWILADITHPVVWLDETDPARFTQGKKIEISKQEVADAVIPLKLIERAKSVAKKVTDVLGLGSRSSRTRGQSSTGSSEAGVSSPPPTMTAHPPPRQDRPPQARGDESIYAALKASREGEHPLSHSVTASPSMEERSRPNMSSQSSSFDRLNENELQIPRRAEAIENEAVMSTAGSVKTIRQSDITQPGLLNSLRAEENTGPDRPSTEPAPETSGSSALSSIFGGAAGSFMRSMRARERRDSGRSSSRPSSSDPLESTESLHGEPSVALSNTSAAGRVNLPTPLRVDSPVGSTSNSPPRPHTSVSERASAPTSRKASFVPGSTSGSGNESSHARTRSELRSLEFSTQPSRPRPVSTVAATSYTSRPQGIPLQQGPRVSGLSKESLVEHVPGANFISSHSSEDPLTASTSQSTSFPSFASMSASSMSPDITTAISANDRLAEAYKGQRKHTTERTAPLSSTAGSRLTPKVSAAPTEEYVVETDEDDSDSDDGPLIMSRNTKSRKTGSHSGSPKRRPSFPLPRRESKHAARSDSVRSVQKVDRSEPSSSDPSTEHGEQQPEQ